MYFACLTMVIRWLNSFPYILKQHISTEAAEDSDAAVVRLYYDLFDNRDFRDYTFGTLRGGDKNKVDTGSHTLSFV